ncbi:MAG: hypothetical protein Q9222_005502, partial [Ikaeria aurantiellina]
MSPSLRSSKRLSLNSWTAQSFTTLQPSDSPSQALFPKHLQALLPLASRPDHIHQVRPFREPKAAMEPGRQTSFLRRNVRFLILGAALHISIIVLTTMLVLIIVAATSKPPQHIKPAYYTWAMLSLAAVFASITMIYVKFQKRKKRHTLHWPDSTPPNNNQPRAGQVVRPLEPTAIYRPGSPSTVPFAVSNWSSRRPQRLRSIMISHNIPSVSAHIAGQTNSWRNVKHYIPTIPTKTQEDIELATLVPPPKPHPACAIKQFLEHELRRQEAIKRRIFGWLQDTVIPKRGSHAPLTPSSLRNSELQEPPPASPPASAQRILPNWARLAELDREVEAYLGIPAPALLWPPRSSSLRSNKELGVRDIDYALLPPAIPRPGAKSRDNVRSDPVTVLHVGPMPPATLDWKRSDVFTGRRENIGE